ncbi:hypothetical protein SAY86_021089 [Trapa natans]|uniref:SHSP domain-containing protein n=1 Tax=Trapa natans TaxID=22666 RepID=A0AAN7MJT7_TRANT|nr:hypothetical protein SAY86_021089 [Trapa natans]
MKVHPVPIKKRNVAIQFGVSFAPRDATSIGPSRSKKLRRLPHIFSSVLELPFRSDADVEVEEGPDFLRFVAETDGIDGDVRAHTVEIYPGITKVVVRPNGSLELLSLDQLELDIWRFRLPQSTRPELASAVFIDGELIVTVPKEEEEEEEEEGAEGDKSLLWGGANGNKLVLVQL